MFILFKQGGFFMWFLLIFALIIVFLTIKKSIQFFGRPDKLSQLDLEKGLNAILFWGCMSGVLGFYAHYLGLYWAMQAIIKAADISPMICAQGYGFSLITLLTGLLLLLFAALFWFILRWKYKQIIQRDE